MTEQREALAQRFLVRWRRCSPKTWCCKLKDHSDSRLMTVARSRRTSSRLSTIGSFWQSAQRTARWQTASSRGQRHP
jgi:hypothetical protein